MALISVDGVELPAPSSFKLPSFDLDSSDTNRNELGILQRDRVRQGIYKIEVAWIGITSTQLALIENAVEPASIDVTFPTATGLKTKQMYAGDRNPEIIKYDSDYTKIRWNISFNLTEY